MNAQLTTLDILYITLSIGFAVFVGGIIFLVHRISRTLSILNVLITHIDDTARDVNVAKNHVKRGLLLTVSSVLGLLLKRR